jgi:hypothetical protein
LIFIAVACVVYQSHLAANKPPIVTINPTLNHLGGVADDRFGSWTQLSCLRLHLALSADQQPTVFLTIDNLHQSVLGGYNLRTHSLSIALNQSSIQVTCSNLHDTFSYHHID